MFIVFSVREAVIVIYDTYNEKGQGYIIPFCTLIFHVTIVEWTLL